jgi:hypothetical protein
MLVCHQARAQPQGLIKYSLGQPAKPAVPPTVPPNHARSADVLLTAVLSATYNMLNTGRYEYVFSYFW